MLIFSYLFIFLFIILFNSNRNHLLLIFAFSLIFGYFIYPFDWDLFGEQFYDYGKFLNYEDSYQAIRAHAHVEPLFFKISELLRDTFNIDGPLTVKLMRYVIFFLTLISMYFFTYHLRNKLIIKNIYIEKKFISFSVFFLCIQWAFSYLVVADQFRQFFAFPFLFIGLTYFLRKNYVTSIFFLSVSYLAHGSSLLVIALFFGTFILKKFKNPISISLLLFISTPIIFFIFKELILVYFPYYDGRLQFTSLNLIQTGVSIGFYLLTLHYLFIISSFLLFANKLLSSENIRIVFYMWTIIFSFFLFPLYNIPFAEPARVASVLAPFSAILFGLAVVKAPGIFRLFLFIESIFTYYLLVNYQGDGKDFQLLANLLFLGVDEIYAYSFDSNIILLFKFVLLSLTLLIFGFLFLKKYRLN